MPFALQSKRSLRKKPGNKTSGEKNASEKQLPNSLIMRVLQDDAAEREADTLSKGVSASSEEDLKAEMGQRLGADFSDVKFHSDTDSRNRSSALGARAWARGTGSRGIHRRPESNFLLWLPIRIIPPGVF